MFACVQDLCPIRGLTKLHEYPNTMQPFVCRGYLNILGSIPNGAGTDGVVVLLSFLLCLHKSVNSLEHLPFLAHASGEKVKAEIGFVPGAK